MLSATIDLGPMLRDLEDVKRTFDDAQVLGALKAAAEVLAQEIRARAPSDQVRGAVEVETGEDGARLFADVVIRGYAASLAIWLEWGTFGHIIRIRGEAPEGAASIRTLNRRARRDGVEIGKRKGSLKIGNRWIGETVWHPGAKEQPFLRPAFDAAQEQAEEAFADHLAQVPA